MDGDWTVRLLYGIIVCAVLFVLFFGKKQEREIRCAASSFALNFLRLANRIAPKPVSFPLTPKALRSIMSIAVDSDTVGFYKELAESLEEIERACGRNGRLRQQFVAPLQTIFDNTREFLIYCEHKGKDEGELEESFTTFLQDQQDFRRTLFKRISKDAGEEFLRLNNGYSTT